MQEIGERYVQGNMFEWFGLDSLCHEYLRSAKREPLNKYMMEMNGQIVLDGLAYFVLSRMLSWEEMKERCGILEENYMGLQKPLSRYSNVGLLRISLEL